MYGTDSDFTCGPRHKEVISARSKRHGCTVNNRVGVSTFSAEKICPPTFFDSLYDLLRACLCALDPAIGSGTTLGFTSPSSRQRRGMKTSDANDLLCDGVASVRTRNTSAPLVATGNAPIGNNSLRNHMFVRPWKALRL